MEPPVEGLLEAALYVTDLDRSVEFYRRIFGFDTLTRDGRICALSVEGRQVLLLMQQGASAEDAEIPGGTIPGSDARGEIHVAFAVSGDALHEWEGWLAGQDVPLESRVRWGRGGRSLYFRDPDGHLLELVSPGCWEIY